MPRTRLAALAVAAFALVACGRDATAPASQLRSDEAQTLALSMAASGDAYAGAYAMPDLVALAPAATVPFGPIAYTTEHPCPRGGTIVPDISVSGQLDMQARSMTVDISGTETPKACAYPVRGNTITVTGNPDMAVTAHMAAANGVPTGAQTFTQKGAFTWTASDGRSGSCALDISSSTDFAKNLRTVTGTFCGRSFSSSGPIR